MADINENPKDAVELSQEELAAKRDEITNYYKDHIPHLQAQLDYENLLRDIEKTRAERVQAQMFVANTMQGPPEMPPAPATGQNPNDMKKEFHESKGITPENAEAKAKALADSIKAESNKRTLKKTT